MNIGVDQSLETVSDSYILFISWVSTVMLSSFKSFNIFKYMLFGPGTFCVFENVILTYY